MAKPFTIRQILFTTDFSDTARAAGATAADLARTFGARLHVLHVVPPVTDATPAPAALRSVAAEFGPGVPAVTAVTSRLAAHQIVLYPRQNAIDVSVMATPGRPRVS